jgi:hypothetical protein
MISTRINPGVDYNTFKVYQNKPQAGTLLIKRVNPNHILLVQSYGAAETFCQIGEELYPHTDHVLYHEISEWAIPAHIVDKISIQQCM